jgi:hypothetical protein
MAALHLCFTAHDSFSLSSADTPPYSGVLVIIAALSLNFWFSLKLTSMQEIGAIIAISVRASCSSQTHSLLCSDGNTPLQVAINCNSSDVAAYLRSVDAAQ